MENSEKVAFKKKARPCVGEPTALRALIDRKGSVIAAELVGYSVTSVSDYASGKVPCPVCVDKAAKFELSLEDRVENSLRHALVVVRRDKRDMFEAMMKGAEIEYAYLPGGK